MGKKKNEVAGQKNSRMSRGSRGTRAIVSFLRTRGLRFIWQFLEKKIFQTIESILFPDFAKEKKLAPASYCSP